MKELTVISDFLLNGSWSCTFKTPEKWYPQWVIAFLQDNHRVLFTIKDDNQKEQKILKECFQCIITKIFEKEFTITLNSNKETLIQEIILHMQHEDEIMEGFLNFPFDISNTKIIHHPEQDVIVAFDFRDILGIPEVNLEAEIKRPDNAISLINASSELFQWRGCRLYCKLTVGSGRLRIRASGIEQPWSKWLPFTCMSKKKYRLSRNK